MHSIFAMQKKGIPRFDEEIGDILRMPLYEEEKKDENHCSSSSCHDQVSHVRLPRSPRAAAQNFHYCR